MLRNFIKSIFTKDVRNKDNKDSRVLAIKPGTSAKYVIKSNLKKLNYNSRNNWKFENNIHDNSARIQIYRFLRNSIPALNAAVWTWISMASSPIKIEIVNHQDEAFNKEVEGIVTRLFKRIHRNSYMRYCGLEALLLEYYNSLFTTGCCAGEVVCNPARDGLDHFYFIDTASLRCEASRDEWQIYQDNEGKKSNLNHPSVYYYGLNVNTTNPLGESLLASVPFVARVEQQLLSDMHKSMHNAGYHRLHVKIKPPERSSGETEDKYINRANRYFEKTAEMFQDFRPEDNPITWDDVEISYIGPGSKIATSRSWYVNHKAMLEDICAGMHLAPFMLGYAYGTTHNWALFKYELVQREVRSIQQAASGFLEWLANLELALKGIPVQVRIKFSNEVIYGLADKLQAEEKRISTIIMKKDAGLIDMEQAKSEVESDKLW